jgi:hypothetical protein
MQAEYKIIGGDGVEYGPATLEELKSWIRDGRVAGMTKVWRNDLAAVVARRQLCRAGRRTWRACTPPPAFPPSLADSGRGWALI